jgi:hypothetical protein
LEPPGAEATDANNPIDPVRPNNHVIAPAGLGRRNHSRIMNRDLIEIFEPKQNFESVLSLNALLSPASALCATILAQA